MEFVSDFTIHYNSEAMVVEFTRWAGYTGYIDISDDLLNQSGYYYTYNNESNEYVAPMSEIVDLSYAMRTPPHTTITTTSDTLRIVPVGKPLGPSNIIVKEPTFAEFIVDTFFDVIDWCKDLFKKKEVKENESVTLSSNNNGAWSRE